MKSFAFSDLNRQSGQVLDAALAEPVTLTKHGKPKVVMLSLDQFEKLAATRAYTIENAPDHMIDELEAGLRQFLLQNGN